MSEVQEEHFLSGDPQPIDMKEMVTKPMEREKKEVFLTYTLQIYHKCYFKYFSFLGKCAKPALYQGNKVPKPRKLKHPICKFHTKIC